MPPPLWITECQTEVPSLPSRTSAFDLDLCRTILKVDPALKPVPDVRAPLTCQPRIFSCRLCRLTPGLVDKAITVRVPNRNTVLQEQITNCYENLSITFSGKDWGHPFCRWAPGFCAVPAGSRNVPRWLTSSGT